MERIGEALKEMQVHDKIPIRFYLWVADSFVQEADLYRNMKCTVDLYIVLLRLLSLLTQTLPNHPDYGATSPAEKVDYRKKLLLALEELASLEPEVMQKIYDSGKDNAAKLGQADNNSTTAVRKLAEYHTYSPYPSAPLIENLIADVFRKFKKKSNDEKPMVEEALKKEEIDSRISLRKLFRMADDLLQQEDIHRQVKSYADLYAVLLRFLNLFTETIFSRQDYNASNQAEKWYYKKHLILALEELRSMHSETKYPRKRDLTKRQYQDTGTSSSHNDNAAETSAARENHPSAPIPSAPPIEILETNHNLVEESKNIDRRLCAVCLEGEVEGACVPCGHMAGCMSCLNQIKAKGWGCPVCRAKIEFVLRLYTV